MKQFELNNGIDHKNLKVPNHLDMSKIKFEVEDLKKLIKATTDDLEEADKQRREEFKRWVKNCSIRIMINKGMVNKGK